MVCEGRQGSDLEVWVTVDAACSHFSVSRSTFYRMLAQPGSELARIVARLPGSNRLRVPLRATERLLTQRSRRRRCTRQDQAIPPPAAEPIDHQEQDRRSG